MTAKMDGKPIEETGSSVAQTVTEKDEIRRNL